MARKKLSIYENVDDLVYERIEFADLAEPADGIKRRTPAKGLWGAVPSDIRREICTNGFFECIPWVITIGKNEVPGIKPELRLKAIDLLGKYGLGEKQEYSFISNAERREIDVRAILLVAEELKAYKEYSNGEDDSSSRLAGGSDNECLPGDSEESTSLHEIHET